MRCFRYLVVITALAGAPQAQAAERVALVIGEANYASAEPLRQSMVDADAIASTLQQLNFDTVLITDATRGTFSEALAKFADRASDAEVALLYFSGYGVSIGQDNYLLPIDAQPSASARIRLDAISLQDATSMLAGARSKLVLVNTPANSPFLAAVRSAVGGEQAHITYAPVRDAGAELFVALAQALKTVTDEPSAFATSVIEGLGVQGSDLKGAIAKAETSGAIEVMHFGETPSDLQPRDLGAPPVPLGPESAAHFNRLGDSFLDGTAGEKNPGMALQMYLKAASYGSLEKAAVIAEMYDTGSGTVPDHLKATEWYKKAGPLGEYQIARRYEFGNGIHLEATESELNGELLKSGSQSANLPQAVVWYKLAAEHGFNRAQRRVGDLLYVGKGLQKDETAALDWYLKAASNDNTPAMRMVAFYYSQGVGMPKDLISARSWLEKAVGFGDVRGIIELAALDLDSSPPDYTAAMELYRKGATTGYGFAMQRVGDLYRDGLGVKQSNIEAIDWYRKAAEAGANTAFNSLGNLYATGNTQIRNYAEAGKWYEKAAAAGDYRGNLMLARLFASGMGYRKDTALAVQLAELALRQDVNARADFSLDPKMPWPSDFLIALQKRLKELGKYPGKINGIMNSATLEAVDALSKR